MSESTAASDGFFGALKRSLPLRLRAAAIHFSLSVIVFAVALYLILVEWYPSFHFRVDGGWQGVRIMAAVDLVLGPALTLIIFNPFKARRLIVFDLSCIAAVQVAALIWGFYAIEGQRPVALNYYDGAFYSMPARSVRADPQIAAYLENQPPQRLAMIYVAMPANADEFKRAAVRAERKQLAHEDPEAFRPLASEWEAIQARAIDPAHARDDLFKRDLPDFLARHGGQAGDYRFFRYQGGYGNCVLALSAAAAPLDAIGCVGL